MENKVTQEDIEYAIYLSKEQYRKYVPPTKYIDTKQPLFTLTAEEIDIVQRALGLLSNDMCVRAFFNPYAKEYYDKANNLLTRIKQWKDEIQK